MASFNKVILIGNLTDTPDLRFTQAGKAMVKFSMAVNDRYKGSNGEDIEKVNFVDVTGFGPQAETIAQFLDKGSPILVEGRLNHERWENKEGEKRSKISVTLRRFTFLPGKRKGDEEPVAA